MAQVLELDPGTYAGTYKLVGGAPALDFANLVSYRGTSREHDWLEPATNLSRWAGAVGLSSPGPAELDAARDLRESVARSFLAIVNGTKPPPDDLAAISDLAAKAWSQRTLRFAVGASSAEWVDTTSSLLTELALDASSLLASPDAVRNLKACPGCGWLFLDTSRNRRRQWCDPADCGNRARQRRHYARQRQP